MSDAHSSKHALVVTQRFVAGGFATVVVVVSVITVATLIYAWFLA